MPSNEMLRRRPRRRRGKPRRTNCQREGCSRHSHAGHDYCSFVCKAIDTEVTKCQRVCETLGDSALTTEMWSEIVALSDAWTRVIDLDREVFQLAKSVGFTDKQWQLIKEG